MFIVTGGGSGIGEALAKALALKGERVLIVGRREALLAKTASYHKNIHYVVADVSISTGRQVIANAVSAELISGIVHNAGTIEPIMPLAKMDETSWRQAMATNVEAPLFLTQQLKRTMNTHARVLHIGSGAAYFPVVGWAPYCVSKAALAMLTQCSQLEYKDIAVASVMPGIIDTDMQRHIRQASDMASEKQAFFKRLKDNNQLLTAETVAAFLCWLLLDVSVSYYTSKEWDIYDTSHHIEWLQAPHKVPIWNNE